MMKISDIEKQHKFATEHATKCKCGHKTLITTKDGKRLCSWCKEFVFVNKEAEIKYRNKEKINKLKGELIK